MKILSKSMQGALKNHDHPSDGWFICIVSYEIRPGFRHFETFVTDLRDAEGNRIDRAPNPMELLTIHLDQPVEAGDMVRARKEGLINLYKEDGTSVTVRA